MTEKEIMNILDSIIIPKSTLLVNINFLEQTNKRMFKKLIEKLTPEELKEFLNITGKIIKI